MPTLLLNICQMPMLCLINRQASSSAGALGQARTGGAVIAWEELPGVLVYFMLVGSTTAHTLPKAGHACPAAMAGPFPTLQTRKRPGQRVRGSRRDAVANKTGFGSDVSPHLSQGVHIPVRLSTTPFVF